MTGASRERFNILTSLPGTLAAPLGLAALVVGAVRLGDPWKIVSFSIYGSTLVLLYFCTTFYHALKTPRAKLIFQKLDHCAIYFLIAGTYTPFCLVTLRGQGGWPLFFLVWGLAGIGLLVEQLPRAGARILPVMIYIVMGWLIVFDLRPLLQAVPWQGVALLGTGGVFYTGGVVFYALDSRFSWAHGCWHLCVLAGSLSHYLSIALYIAPA